MHILIFSLFPIPGLNAQPFPCTGDFILTISSDTEASNFYKLLVSAEQGGTIIFEEISQKQGPYLNAIGYRKSDNYIYGIAPKDGDLYRLDASGNTVLLHHFNWFDNTKNYNAGAITPDGKFLVVLSGNPTSPPLRSLELITIDLESPVYATKILPLKTRSGGYVYSLDIAFDPFSGELYGFDGIKGRLITINIFSAQVDDITFPALGLIRVMAAMFFDPLGNLYGYAQETDQSRTKSLYRVDKFNGNLEFLLEGPAATAADGCSCPYRVKLLKSVVPRKTYNCSEIDYVFTIANASDISHFPVQFFDEFPPDFEILEIIGNTYGGQIATPNYQTLVIENMQITPGIDSFKIRVAVNEITPGLYKNQAVLNNLPSVLGRQEKSDDPFTIPFDDSTIITIQSTDLEIEDRKFKICPGDTMVLDASTLNGNFNYFWENGSMEPTMTVSESGIYPVEVSNICKTKTINFYVEHFTPEFELDLGQDRIINLGERILLDPKMEPGQTQLFQWNETPGQTINCHDCLTQNVFPLESTTYFFTLTDHRGCTFSDSVHIVVEKSYKIYVPNAFSPNGDGINDRFFVNGPPGSQVFFLRVYNRWGDLIFEVTDGQINDPATSWNGTVRGKKMAPGVYLWMAQIIFLDGNEKIFSGDVVILY